MRLHAVVCNHSTLFKLPSPNSSYGPRLMNCWLPAETWVEILKRTGHVDASLAIDARKFNAAFAKSSSFGNVMSRFDGSNNTGVFHVRFQHRQYYYFTQEKRQVPYPNPLNQAWKLRVLEAAANVLVIPSSRSLPGLLGESATADDEKPSPSKRPRREDKEEPEKDQQQTNTTVMYWPDSPEARQVFQPLSTGRCASSTRRRSRGIASAAPLVGDANTTPEYETAKEALERRIRLLQYANESEDGWRDIIVMGRDADDYCTKLEILQIRQRSTFLCCAYQLALSNMNEVTWHDCCKRACHLLNGLGF